MPEVGQDIDAAPLQLGGLRVLVLVDHVLVEALGHQQLRLRLHPGRDECREVEPGVAVQDQLIPDYLQRSVRQHPLPRYPVTRDRVLLLADVQGINVELSVHL